jgi:hypothetical protein
MPHALRTDPKVARQRREKALIRGEFRTPTSPRVSSAGLTSFAIKAEDPETRRMIDEYIANRGRT